MVAAISSETLVYFYKVSYLGEVHIGFGRKTLGKEPLGRPRNKWDEEIEMYP